MYSLLEFLKFSFTILEFFVFSFLDISLNFFQSLSIKSFSNDNPVTILPLTNHTISG